MNHILLEVATETYAFAGLYHTDVKRSGVEERKKTRSTHANATKLRSVDSSASIKISREQEDIEVAPVDK